MYSLFKNNIDTDRIRVFIIDDSISDENRSKLKACAEQYGRELIFIDAQKLMEAPDSSGMQSYGGTRKNTHSFLKILAIDQLPSDTNRIIYLDGDTLVLGNLTPLASYDMNDCTVAMALDSLVDTKKDLIGFKRSDPYYNSGVILIDCKRWKEKNCEKRLREHSMDHSYGTVDQDLLNVVLKGDICTLPPEYNFQPHHLVYKEKDYFSVFKHTEGGYYSEQSIQNARNNICVMHFFRYLGQQPWHKDNLHPCTPYFDTYLSESLWNDYVKKESTNGAIFTFERALYRILPKRLFLRLFTAFFALKLKKDIKLSA